MDFDSNRFSPAPNNWFQTNIEYEGHGRAEFLEPKGAVEGSVKIKFDEFGKNEVIMDVESAISEQNIFKLLHQNTCSFLEVTKVDGKFYSVSNIYFNYQLDTETKLDFHIPRSIFQPNKRSSSYYWVLSLSNFISSFMSDDPKLDRHAIRIFSIPKIPDDLDEHQKLTASVRIKQHNRLIIFNFLNRLGFIEPLPDYDARRQMLLEGRAQRIITSLMIGEIGSI